MRGHCRCSTAAYAESDEEYEKWFKETTGKHSAQWELNNVGNLDKQVDSQGLKLVFGSRVRFKTGNNSLDEYVDKKRRKKFFGLPTDITEEWKKGNDSVGTFKRRNYAIINGDKRIVDEKYVLFDLDDNEDVIGETIATKYNKNVVLLPRINSKKGESLKKKKSADYEIDGERYDLKTPRGNSKNTLDGMVKEQEKQAHNFIYNLNKEKTDMSIEEALKQINRIYCNPNRYYVNVIVLMKNDTDVIKVFKRTK